MTSAVVLWLWTVAAIVLPIACQVPVPLGPWLALAAYAPLYIVLRDRPSGGTAPLGSAALGMVAGATQVLVLGNWSVITLEYWPLALSFLAFYNGALWCAACLAIRLLLRGPVPLAALAVAVIPLVEWFRAVNPVLPIGYALTPHMITGNPFFAQSVEWIGLSGVSLFISTYSWLLTSLYLRQQRAVGQWAFGTLLLLLLHLGGVYRAGQFEPTYTFDIALVQQFCPRSGACDLTAEKQGFRQQIGQVLACCPGSLLLLPEEAVYRPADQLDDQLRVDYSELLLTELRQILDTEKHRYAVAGLLTELPCNEGFRNSAALIDVDRGTLTLCDKHFPAPIGEAVPLRLVPFLGQACGWLWGRDNTLRTIDRRTTLEIPGGPMLAVALCNEHTLPDIWRRKGLNSLAEIDCQLILADTRWFDYSDTERRQSRAARQLLAIRNRRPVLMIANGGSEWIDQTGQLRDFTAPHDLHAEWQISMRPRIQAWQLPEGVFAALLVVALAASIPPSSAGISLKTYGSFQQKCNTN